MADRFPNVPKLLGQLTPGSLAHQLCACFLGAKPADDLSPKVRAVLEARKSSTQQTLQPKKGPKS